MKNKLINSALFFLFIAVVACTQPEAQEVRQETPEPEQSPEVKFIMQYEGKLFDGDVRRAIEGEVGTLTIDFNKSVVNEYWIAKGEKTGVYVKIKEPEYTIMQAYEPSEYYSIGR
jgi:hypothetical protein